MDWLMEHAPWLTIVAGWVATLGYLYAGIEGCRALWRLTDGGPPPDRLALACAGTTIGSLIGAVKYAGYMIEHHAMLLGLGENWGWWFSHMFKIGGAVALHTYLRKEWSRPHDPRKP